MVELSGKDRALNEFSVERLGEDVENNLVMLHGYGAGLGFFYRNFESLSRAEGWKVFALDLLGMGRSSRPAFKIHAKDKEGKIAETESWFVDALEEWRIKRGLDRFTLLGHSLGGYLAVAYALKYPGHLNKLILASPVGIPEDPYAVDEEMPDPQDSTMANEFTQDAADTNRNGVQPSTADNNNFMNQRSKNGTYRLGQISETLLTLGQRALRKSPNSHRKDDCPGGFILSGRPTWSRPLPLYVGRDPSARV